MAAVVLFFLGLQTLGVVSESRSAGRLEGSEDGYGRQYRYSDRDCRRNSSSSFNPSQDPSIHQSKPAYTIRLILLQFPKVTQSGSGLQRPLIQNPQSLSVLYSHHHLRFSACRNLLLISRPAKRTATHSTQIRNLQQGANKSTSWRYLVRLANGDKPGSSLDSARTDTWGACELHLKGLRCCQGSF